MPEQDRLRQAAERAASRPFFLASALLALARAEGLDDTALAERLGCAQADLPSLLLCRRPTETGSQFRMDVERIADRFGLDPIRLAEIIRTADALVAFGGRAAEGPGRLLAAARDRDDADPTADRSPDPPAPPAPPERDR